VAVLHVGIGTSEARRLSISPLQISMCLAEFLGKKFTFSLWPTGPKSLSRGYNAQRLFQGSTRRERGSLHRWGMAGFGDCSPFFRRHCQEPTTH